MTVSGYFLGLGKVVFKSMQIDIVRILRDKMVMKYLRYSKPVVFSFLSITIYRTGWEPMDWTIETVKP